MLSMARPNYLALAVIVTVIIVCSPDATAQHSDIAVIVNPSNPVTTLSLSDLRKILSGDKHNWAGSLRVKIVVRAPGTRERLTLLRILGMSESEYKQFWTAQVFRGEADAEPTILPSFGMVKEAVSTFPGAIALVEAQDIREGMALKVVKIDGKSPGDPGYPLH
jgi:ABC-type phosphate transport system substrate-binding protein